MTDPYADPTDRSTEPDLVSQGEVRSPLEQFLARLRDLGATPDELDAVAGGWDNLDPDDDDDPDAWTRARRDHLARVAGDAELSALIAAARSEYETGTVTEDEADARARAAALDAALAEAAGRIGANVQSVLAWVADDAARAEAVLRLELAPEGAGRTTLVAPLAEQLGWTAEDVGDVTASYGAPAEPQEPADGAEAVPGPDAAAEGPEAQEGAQGPESGGAEGTG